MKKLIAYFGLLSLLSIGCATPYSDSDSDSEGMYGGLADDHFTTVAECGVGNYKFRYLKEPCTFKSERINTAQSSAARTEPVMESKPAEKNRCRRCSDF